MPDSDRQSIPIPPDGSFDDMLTALGESRSRTEGIAMGSLHFFEHLTPLIQVNP